MNFTLRNDGVALQINDFDIRDINEESAEVIKDKLKEHTIVVLKRQDRTCYIYKFYRSYWSYRKLESI